VDDELRQNGSTSDMVHSIPFLISYISRIMTLEEGDLIITGTPEGVGPVPPNSVRGLVLCHPARGFALTFVHMRRFAMSRRSRQVSPTSLR
jgi:2-keto-4-pentenoate hydratase/2-oxohepta-3-ene-1,7-dioic acid hydratase in catechol pathway